jgi:hypothetical protein
MPDLHPTKSELFWYGVVTARVWRLGREPKSESAEDAACHSLGNSVRHNPEKVLRRHDAGVMLHGLCTLLYRPSE